MYKQGWRNASLTGAKRANEINGYYEKIKSAECSVINFLQFFNSGVMIKKHRNFTFAA